MIPDSPLQLLRQGSGRYGGEPVTQLDHALQAAALADRSGAGEALVVAALLHDIGHLLGPDTSADTGHDRQHELIGAKLLRRWGFGDDVVEPVRLHVPAKRYLARNSRYLGTLSAESIASLAAQGGPMTDEEAALFTANPWSECAVRLRRWDDQAKVEGLSVAGLDAYRGLVHGLRLAKT